MSDTDNKLSIDNQNQVQFLTVSYNPSSHPKQICLLDPCGQSILYTLTPANQPIPPSMVLQGGSHNIGVIPNRNGCFICGAQAVDKCYYGAYKGSPCGLLLCLAHAMEAPNGTGGKYIFCPEHFERRKKECIIC